jgi:hypothetical protein
MSSDSTQNLRINKLIEAIDALAERSDGSGYFHDAKSLAANGRGNPAVIAAMIERLKHQDAHIREAAMNVFRFLGSEVCNREPEILDLLFSLGDWRAYASVGRHRPEVRQWILEKARNRPPRWQESGSSIGDPYDEVMLERGCAIHAMQHFSDYPDECLPVLIDALENFEEYDPDEERLGPHNRIASVLEHFGPKAAPAAVPLARHLRDDPDEEYPRAILCAIASMGDAAVEALPLLEDFRKEFRKQARGNREWPPLDQGPVDNELDLDGWLIQRLRAVIND